MPKTFYCYPMIQHSAGAHC